MKRFFFYLFLLSGILLIKCQKELSFDSGGAPSQGSLLDDGSGDCLPKTVNGSYIAQASLTNSNTIQVTVNVTKVGSYNIFSDTVDNYYFKATGIFSTLGSHSVTLKGSGKPLQAGVDNFLIQYDSTACSVPVTVLPAGTGNAVMMMDCTNATVNGTYQAGTILNSSNTVVLPVTVTTAGAYSINGSGNGMTFSGSGTVTTSTTSITLQGNGTPTTTQTTNILISFGTSSCSFMITVGGASGSDYFPRTTNSNWTYMFDNDPTDTVRRYVIASTKSALGNVYNIFMETDGSTTDSSGYYRKSAGNYYSYGDLGGPFNFDNPVRGEFIFIKDNVATNTIWYSSPISGTIGGIPISVRYKETIQQKDVPIVVNGTTYQNTIAIKVQFEANLGGTWTDLTPANGYTVVYYSRNVGLIKTEIFDGTGTLSDHDDIVRYQVF